MSTIVEHARRELALIETDPWMINGLIKTIEAFVSMGHSGSTAEVAIPLLNRLLLREPLTPLTDDPSEWEDRTQYSSDGQPLWQNIRNSKAFSHDGGKSYWTLEENDDPDHRPLYQTEVTGKRHKSWDHPEDDHSVHIHVNPLNFDRLTPEEQAQVSNAAAYFLLEKEKTDG
jgi:hypothetical protein